MSGRIGLIIVQAIGALSIIPYPFVLIANIMSIAAEGQTVAGAAPFVLLSLYPAVWIVLDVLAWRAMGRGSVGLAFVYSSVPVVLSLGGVLFFMLDTRAASRREKDRLRAVQARVNRANPLAWTLMCYYGRPRYQGTTPVSLDTVLKAIAGAPGINDPVPEDGTPLRIALWNLKMRWDGTPGGDRPEERVRIVRELIAHGAQLSGDERTFLQDVVRVKLARLKDPAIEAAETEHENPLVWRIVKSAGRARVELRPEDTGLLNRPTRLYGTPLLASMLLLDQGALAADLIEAGARLSREEERDPAGKQALEDLFKNRPQLRRVYGRSPETGPARE